MRSPRRLALAVLIILSLASTAPASRMGRNSASPADPGPRAPRRLEVQDDPPAKANPRLEESARSIARIIEFNGFTSVQVNVDARGLNIVGDAANEPSIAVNPLNRANMVIGWRQFDSITSNFRQAGWAYTFDNGATWTFPGVLQTGVFRSDPVVDADSQGNFYYQSLRGSPAGYLVDVFKSTDGGATWLPPTFAWGGDKNWMVVDRSGGPSDGHIYGIWQKFFTQFAPNVFTRSANGAVSFEPPVPVALWPTFGTMAVGPSGEVYAAGADGTLFQDLDRFVVAKSVNARNPGVIPTFTGVVVDLGGAMGFGGDPNPGGLLGQANVVVDRSPGPTRGNVYLVSSATPFAGTDPLDVHFSRSVDGGATWSPPQRINDDYDPSGVTYQWFAAASVSANGRIDVIWYDNGCPVERDSSGATIVCAHWELSQLRYRWSYDGGATWLRSVPVSPPFNSLAGYPRQNKIGDYITLDSDETGADVAYAATFNGEQDVYYVRIFPDCNGNGASDEIDLTHGTSQDVNHDRIPDECRRTPERRVGTKPALAVSGKRAS